MSSKRGVRRRSCSKKVKHESQEAAYAHLAHLRKTTGYRGAYPYQCSFCGAWHIGRADNNKRKSIAAKASNDKSSS
jgi:hypothetical protein